LVAQRCRDGGFRRGVEIDQATRDLVAEIAQAQQLRIDIVAQELRRELRECAVVRVAGFDADREDALGHTGLLAGLPRIANEAAALPVPSRAAALIPVLPLIFPARL